MRMWRIILIFLFLSFQSLAEDSKNQLPSCEGDHSNHCYGTYANEWAEGHRFEGEFVYGEPPGCNPYKEALKLWGSSGEWINMDEILAEAWAKCFDEGL